MGNAAAGAHPPVTDAQVKGYGLDLLVSEVVLSGNEVVMRW